MGLAPGWATTGGQGGVGKAAGGGQGGGGRWAVGGGVCVWGGHVSRRMVHSSTQTVEYIYLQLQLYRCRPRQSPPSLPPTHVHTHTHTHEQGVHVSASVKHGNGSGGLDRDQPCLGSGRGEKGERERGWVTGDTRSASSEGPTAHGHSIRAQHPVTAHSAHSAARSWHTAHRVIGVFTQPTNTSQHQPTPTHLAAAHTVEVERVDDRGPQQLQAERPRAEREHRLQQQHGRRRRRGGGHGQGGGGWGNWS